MRLRILQSDSWACNLTAGVARYRFAEYREDQYVRLQRFADYTARDDAPNYQTGNKIAYPDELLFRIVPEASTRVAGLEAREYLAASNYDGEKVIVQTIASSASHVRTGLSIAEQLQSVGINAEMVQYDVQTWAAKRRDPNELNIYTSGGYWIDPSLYHPEFNGTFPSTEVGYYHDETEEVFRGLAAETDFDNRYALGEALQCEFYNKVATITSATSTACSPAATRYATRKATWRSATPRCTTCGLTSRRAPAPAGTPRMVCRLRVPTRSTHGRGLQPRTRRRGRAWRRGRA